MGKNIDFFKKIRDTKRTFHTKMHSVKDRNGMELAEAEDLFCTVLLCILAISA